MTDSDNLESERDQPPAKKPKSHYDTLLSHHTHQSSQGSQNIIIETGHHQNQLKTRHTINLIVNNNKKKGRHKRYREQNRDKLKQSEAERRKRIQNLQSIAVPSTSSNTNRIELNNKEIITAQSSSGLEKTDPLSIQRNEPGDEMNALQKKRERQQRYREQNRDKLKQREAERRRRLQNAEMITELSTSPNIEFTEIINDPIIDEKSTNSQSVAGFGETQHLVVEVSQQNGRGAAAYLGSAVSMLPEDTGKNSQGCKTCEYTSAHENNKKSMPAYKYFCNHRHIKSEPLSTDNIKSEPLSTDNIMTEPLSTHYIKSEPLCTDDIECEPWSTDDIKSEPLCTDDIECEPLSTDNIKSEPLNTDDIETEPLSTYDIESEPSKTYDIEFEPRNSSSIKTEPLSSEDGKSEPPSTYDIEFGPPNADTPTSESIVDKPYVINTVLHRYGNYNTTNQPTATYSIAFDAGTNHEFTNLTPHLGSATETIFRKSPKTFSPEAVPFRINKTKSKEHNKSQLSSCKTCSKAFSSEDQLRIHKRNVHTRTRLNKHVCKHCQMVFKTEHLLLRHKDKFPLASKIVCEHCKMNFCTNTQLKRHKCVVQITDHVICEHCRGNFNTKLHLEPHMKFVHHYVYSEDLKISTLKSDDKPNESDVFAGGTKIVKTEPVEGNSIDGDSFCELEPKLVDKPVLKTYTRKPRKTMSKEKLPINVTVKSEHPSATNLGPSNSDVVKLESPSIDDFSVHLENIITCQRNDSEHEFQYFCHRCPKKFKLKIPFKRHLASAHNSVAHTCNYCSNTFKSKYFLKIHTNEVHTGVSYDCVECLQTFKSRYLLKVHVDQTHIGRTYDCEQCSKIFRSKYLLRVHTEEIHKCGVYNCELCLKLFKSKYYLMQHISKKHNGGNFGMVHDAKNLSSNAMKSILSTTILGQASRALLDKLTKPKPIANTVQPSIGSQSKTSAIQPCETLLTDSVTSRARDIVRESFEVGETECESHGDIANHTEPSRDLGTESRPLNSIIESSMEDFEMKQQVKPESFQDIDFGQLLF